MGQKYYYFYDLNEILIDRYPAKIAHRIRLIKPNSNFIFIYSEKYHGNSPKKIPKGSKSYFIPDLNESKIKKLISKYPPYSLTTIAQRIPDMWMLSLFNNINIETNIVQHGLWSDRLQRISLFSLLIKKFSKFLHYVNYSRKICKINKIPTIPTLKDLYDFLLIENKSIPETTYLDNDNIRAKRVFAFDSSWDNYYVKKYGYKKNKLVYIGNPDLLLLKNIDISKKESSICYLCQSLVEDGRLEKYKYKKFIAEMVNFLPPSKKLYIKIHPRSRMDIYSDIKDQHNVIFTKNLPVCDTYVGHYTGLLATVKHISDNILIWEFTNHHTPNYFKKFGSIVTSDYSQLSNFMNDRIKTKQNFLGFKKYSSIELRDFDPIKVIAQKLIIE